MPKRALHHAHDGGSGAMHHIGCTNAVHYIVAFLCGSIVHCGSCTLFSCASLLFPFQNTEQETKRLMSRLESTEQRQQQMMAFLAKAVQNPAFLQELLNQRQAQRISGPDKSKFYK